MFTIGFITDEVSQNLFEAAKFAYRFQFSAVELRSVEGKGPFEWDESDKNRIRDELNQFGLTLKAISTPLFKCDISDEGTIQAHIASFSTLADFAKTCGCSILRGFDFWESGAPLSLRVEKLRPIVKICEEKDVTLALEYDPSVHSNTPDKIAELVRTIGSDHVRALYDPGNGLWSDPSQMPYPTGYNVLKDLFCHIHVKDAILTHEGAQAVCVGTGLVDYLGLFRELKATGYDGCVMLETHYRKDSKLSEEQLRTPGGITFSNGAEDASMDSMEAMLKIIHNA